LNAGDTPKQEDPTADYWPVRSSLFLGLGFWIACRRQAYGNHEEDYRHDIRADCDKDCGHVGGDSDTGNIDAEFCKLIFCCAVL